MTHEHAKAIRISLSLYPAQIEAVAQVAKNERRSFSNALQHMIESCTTGRQAKRVAGAKPTKVDALDDASVVAIMQALECTERAAMHNTTYIDVVEADGQPAERRPIRQFTMEEELEAALGLLERAQVMLTGLLDGDVAVTTDAIADLHDTIASAAEAFGWWMGRSDDHVEAH